MCVCVCVRACACACVRVSVWGLVCFLLFSSRPRRATSSMKEVIIGRSRALPGGTTCIWIQAPALSQDLSLVYCICTTLSLTLESPFIHSVSHALTVRLHYQHDTEKLCDRMDFFKISIRFYTAFLFTDRFSCLSHPLQCKSRPPPPDLPTVLKQTCQALPLKGIHLIYCLPPSFL